MGGNALSVPTRRITQDEYMQVAASLLRSGGNSPVYRQFKRAGVIQSYENKESFGDIDILIETDGSYDLDMLKRGLSEEFGTTEFFKNGNCLSFDFRKGPFGPELKEEGFQVDFIFAPQEEFGFSFNYFAFNDLGNLIGRTAHKMGLKFGHDGLWFPYRKGDYMFREILVTRDFRSALEFLGYDYDRYCRGFKEITDIFEYVASSKYFNRDIFLLDNRNAESRIRDRKRKTYMEFLKWCEEHDELPYFEYPSSKDVWIHHIMDHFPEFEQGYRETTRDLYVQTQIKSKFNGDRVTRLTGLEGKELGMFMSNFKKSFEHNALFEEFILVASIDEIEHSIVDMQKNPWALQHSLTR